MDTQLRKMRSSKIAFEWTEKNLVSFYVESNNVLQKNQL